MMVRALLTLLSTLALLMAMAPRVANAAEFDAGPPLDGDVDYYAVIHTSKGPLPVALFADVAPRAVQNFVNLSEGTAEWMDMATGQRVRRPYYNGLKFHRVIPAFMVQTGDQTATGMGGPGYKFHDEFDETVTFSKPGILGMANAGLNDNGSQFFVTEIPTPHLNGRHTIFGELLDPNAVAIVSALANVERDPSDRPRVPQMIERVEIHRLEKDLDAPAALRQIMGSSAPAAAQSGGPTINVVPVPEFE